MAKLPSCAWCGGSLAGCTSMPGRIVMELDAKPGGTLTVGWHAMGKDCADSDPLYRDIMDKRTRLVVAVTGIVARGRERVIAPKSWWKRFDEITAPKAPEPVGS